LDLLRRIFRHKTEVVAAKNIYTTWNFVICALRRYIIATALFRAVKLTQCLAFMILTGNSYKIYPINLKKMDIGRPR